MAFYKRTSFLVNNAFQLKFSLIICSLIFCSSLIYPLVFIDFINEFVGNQNAPRLVVSARNDLLIYLGVIQLLFTGIVFILAIFLTHKIAGPMHKLKMHFSRIRQGEAITPLTFRSGDYFKDVAEEVTLFLETVQMNQEADFKYLDEVSLYLNNLSSVIPDDKRPVLMEISRRLSEIQARYNRPL